MNITRENISDVSAFIKIAVENADYQPLVDQTLADYRKKAAIPGFRKGKVPMGLIKKQYGKSVLADELNKLVSQSLFNFIEEEKLNILGNPLPKEGEDFQGDFDQPSTFEFTYEIGLAPELEVKLSGRNKFEYPKVIIDESLIQKQIDDLRRRYGKLSSGESVGETDMILGQFVELNEDGSIKEGGIMHSSTIAMQFTEDEATKKELMGKKVGDKINVDPYKVSKGGKDTAAMLGVKEADLANISSLFQLTINDVKVMELAELNQELYDKLFGEGVVNSEEELKNKIKADLEEMFSRDSDRILARRITNSLIDKTVIELPDAFLKRWILASQKEDNNKNPLTAEQIEAEYEGYQRGLKWQLIKDHLIKNNDLAVTQEELIAHTKTLMAGQYAQYGIPAPEDEELTQTARQVLSNREEASRIAEGVAEEKLNAYFKATVKIDEKEVTYDEYIKIAEDANA